MKRRILFFVFMTLTLVVPKLKADHTMEILVKMVGPDSNSNMGTSVAGLGDINHDGFDDVGVSVYGSGKVFVYYGGDSMDDEPDLSLTGTWTVASAGDVNGNGYIDVMTSDLQNVYIYYGGETGLDTIIDVTIPGEFPQDLFGWYLIPAGDVNKDNYDDILTLAPNYPNGTPGGKAYLYHGGDPMDTIPEWTIAGEYGKKRVQSVSALDFNGDEWVDIVVGKLGRYVPETDSLPGEVDIFFGGEGDFDTIPDLVINPPDTLSYFEMAYFGGWWVSNLGDFNHDGYEDLGILLGVGCGRPLVYFGGDPPDTLPGLILGEGFSSSSNFTCAGDVNKDGFSDVVNGYECWGMGWGAVELYLGGLRFDAQKDRWMTGSDFPPDFLEDVGRCVASAGDVNGDGTDDIIFSAENFYPTNRGEVFILAGDTSISTGVDDHESEEINRPYGFLLSQNYPNPFNSVTSIQFTVGSRQSPVHATLKIYNMLGQLVRIMVDEQKSEGSYTVHWDGRNKNGEMVSSGIYFYKLEADKFTDVKKMVLLR